MSHAARTVDAETIHSGLRWIGWIAGTPFALAALYLIFAIILGAIPVNTGFVHSERGVPVYLRTNGVHAELILPTRANGVDWSLDFPATDMRALAEPLPWVAFGWGDRGFFVNTPNWSDLKASTALWAISGLGDGAMHVEYIETPRAYKARELLLSREEYARLASYIHGSFRRGQSDRPIRINAPGYFEADAFYEAVPNYKLWFTCNDWVRRALTVTGVRAPLWSPFETALFLQLPESPKPAPQPLGGT
jgi:uncharacterized protein (TIGR02117 family)